MQHGQKIHEQPKNLIKQTGNIVLEVPEGHMCCGSAGTYNILHQKMAKSLLKNKVENIEKISFLLTGGTIDGEYDPAQERKTIREKSIIRDYIETTIKRALCEIFDSKYF